MAVCTSCGGRLLWVTSQRGKPMPLDAEPVEGGNVVLRGGTGVVIAPESVVPEPRYRSHFATCPQAAQHRRRS